MPRVRFTLTQVKDYPDTRPQGCPHCGSVFLHRHGEVTKPIRDLDVSEVNALRYRCTDCHRTFQTLPAGCGPPRSESETEGVCGIELGAGSVAAFRLLICWALWAVVYRG